MVESLLDRLATSVADGLLGQGPDGARALTRAMIELRPPESDLPAYLRRVWSATPRSAGRPSPASTTWLSTPCRRSTAPVPPPPATIRRFAPPSSWPTTWGVLLLRDRLTEGLGFDPLSQTGMACWAVEIMATYAGGLRPGTPAGPKQRPAGAQRRPSASPLPTRRPRQPRPRPVAARGQLAPAGRPEAAMSLWPGCEKRPGSGPDREPRRAHPCGRPIVAAWVGPHGHLTADRCWRSLEAVLALVCRTRRSSTERATSRLGPAPLP